MFTGLIDHTGTITQITTLAAGIRLTLNSQFTDLVDGESIAVDGICLTAIHITQTTFELELSQETLDVTIAKQYKVGQQLNLERVLRLQDRLGGHFVSGHVDQTARVKNIKKHHDFMLLLITDLTPSNLRYLIPKGSICINGVSLTINQLNNCDCHCMLIPHTLAHTNLAALTKDSRVNVEFDLLAKIIVHQQAQEKIYAKSI